MATPLARKTCPRCNTECLESESCCWACGAPFVAPAPGAGRGASAPTLVGSVAPTVSMTAHAPGASGAPARRRMHPLLPIGVAVLMLALGVTLRLATSWYEASQSQGDAGAIEALRVETARVPGPEAPGATLEPGDMGAAPAPPRQTRTNRPTAPPSPPREVWRPAPAIPAPRPRPAPPVFPRSSPPRPALAPSRPVVPAAPAATGDGLVAIENGTGAPLDFMFGTGQTSGTVAPYSRIVVPLAGGEYDLTLRGGGRKETLYDIQVERGQSYRVVFDSGNARLHARP